MQKTENDHMFRSFAKYAGLNIIGMIGLSCYILADTFFVAKSLGTVGLAALNIALPVFGLVNGLGLMIGMGGATRYSIWGKESTQDKRNAIFSQSVYLCVAISLILLCIGAVFAGGISTLLGADAEAHSLTTTYLRVVMLFAPAFMLNHTFICFVRNDGAPRLAMAAMLVGSFSNIVLDYVFIFPLDMGMFGAVLATGLAPIISIAVLSLHVWKRKNGAKLVRTRINMGSVHDICALGVSSLIGEMSSAVVIVVFNIVVFGLGGNVGVAAYGVIANIALVVVAMLTGVAQGIQPLISRYHGKENTHAMRKIYTYALITGVTMATFVYFAACVGSQSIISIFNTENDIVLAQIATKGMFIYFTAFIFVGINIISATYFSSTERAKQAFAVSILRGFVLIVPVTLVMSGLFGMTGVWLSVPLTELSVSCVVLFLMIKKRVNIEKHTEV